jgi:uncharacterized membrane protein HdeD (DUF308 family)
MFAITDSIDDLLSKWWLLLIRGVAAVVFAILAFTWPGLTLFVLVFLFGVYALADGFVGLGLAFLAARQRLRWWPFLLEGIAGATAGIMTFVWPGITAVALLYLIAAWAIITEILEIVAAFRLRQAIRADGCSALAACSPSCSACCWPPSPAQERLPWCGSLTLTRCCSASC